MSIHALAKSLPRTIQLGHLPYTVKFADGWIKFEDERRWGECDHSTATITLVGQDIFPSKEMLVSVFLHEVLHALWTQANLPTKGVKEEQAVGSLETVLTAFIKNNPKVMTWVTKGLK